jgi:hypothetical protein
MAIPPQQGLPQLLRQLAAARTELKGQEYIIKAEQAYAELRHTERMLADGTLGKNKEHRDSQLAAAVDSDHAYRQARSAYLDAVGTVGRLEAEVQILHELRRERELDVRERFLSLAEQGRLPGPAVAAGFS